MNIILGFITKSGHISNVSGTVSEFYELSPAALTFSRQRGEYQDSAYQGDTLHTMLTIDQLTEENYVLPEGQINEILSVAHTALSYITSHVAPYDELEFKLSLQAEYGDRIQNLTHSVFYEGTQLTHPEWLEWESLTFPETKIKIWFRNESFENQYSNYEIIVVPPVDNLDAFFGPYGAMVGSLATSTVSETMEKIQTTKGAYPDTYTRIFEFNYLNPINLNQKTPVRWGVLIYGRNGDNIDAIKDTLISYILANSTHTQAEWELIFPDIFRRTEFLFWPRWDKIAIPNLTVLAGVYSPLAEPLESIAFAKAKWPMMSPDFVENNLTILPFDYKAITLLALNGETNMPGRTRLRDVVADYIPVSTQSLDFNRMSLFTREWALKMVELIVAAETATEYSSITNPLRRIIRHDVLYITRMYEGINFMVAARKNMEA